MAKLTGYRSIIFDLPEHGRSTDVGEFDMQRAAELVLAEIRGRNLVRPCLIGLSLGAQVALTALATSPEQLGDVILLGCSVRPIPLLGRKALLRPIFAMYAPFQNFSFLIRANQRSLSIPDEYSREFAEDTRRATPGMLTRIYAANQAFQLPPGLTNALNRVLVLAGAKEFGIMKRSAQDIAAALAEAAAYEVKGMPHNWPIGHPDLCARTIRSWVAKSPLPPELEPM